MACSVSNLTQSQHSKVALSSSDPTSHYGAFVSTLLLAAERNWGSLLGAGFQDFATSHCLTWSLSPQQNLFPSLGESPRSSPYLLPDPTQGTRRQPTAGACLRSLLGNTCRQGGPSVSHHHRHHPCHHHHNNHSHTQQQKGLGPLPICTCWGRVYRTARHFLKYTNISRARTLHAVGNLLVIYS